MVYKYTDELVMHAFVIKIGWGGGGPGVYSDFYLLHRLTLFFLGQNFEIYYFGGLVFF